MASDFRGEIKARDYSALSSGPNVITWVTTFKRVKTAVPQTAVQTEKARDSERDELAIMDFEDRGSGATAKANMWPLKAKNCPEQMLSMEMRLWSSNHKDCTVPITQMRKEMDFPTAPERR